MLEFIDYSTRRGAMVALLPKIHALLTEIAVRDKIAGITPPEHLVSWQHKARKELLEVNRRFLVAMDGNLLAGLFFYRYNKDKAGKNNIYIEDVQIAWVFHKNPLVLEGLLKKLEYDADARNANFFASNRIRVETNKEILASVGFKEEKEGDWENLGNFKEMTNALKVRYSRV